MILTSAVAAKNSVVRVIWLGFASVMNNLSILASEDRSLQDRYKVSLDTINMAKDFPIFGTGTGTFHHVYPIYKTLESQLYWEHAHNDYLELLSDNGLAGSMIVLSGVVIFLWKTLTKWWERRHYYVKGVTLGGVCSIVAILVHSLVDFNLHIPANALIFSIILGLTHNTVNLKSTKIKYDVN